MLHIASIVLGLHLYSGERSDDFLDNYGLAYLHLISGTILRAPSKVDLIEVECPEFRSPQIHSFALSFGQFSNSSCCVVLSSF